MILLSDLLNPQELNECLNAGLINRRTHPTEPLAIYNYTARAQYENTWSHEVRVCRGLIVNTNTGEVVARPFPKFFNYRDPHAPVIGLDEEVWATDKMDGSLGILYPLPSGGHAIATRGSFTSEQAMFATDLYQRQYAHRWTPWGGWTYLFEIVYPANRIVVDYGDARDLHLLAQVLNEDGQTFDVPVPGTWKGPVAKCMATWQPLADVLAMPPRPNAEGLVLTTMDGRTVKVKQDDYVALHAILTNTTARRVWEFMAVNACKHLVREDKHWGTYLHLDPARAHRVLAAGDDWIDGLTENVPDEFHRWLRAKIMDIEAAVTQLRAEIHAEYDRLTAAGVTGGREFHEATLPHTHQNALLQLRRGRDISLHVWYRSRPEHEIPFATVSEDTA